jgi:AcrR family transcriptional regulator
MASAAETVGRHKPVAASARSVAGDEQIRHALLDAAIASILERGYYRASSNEIARRADVTWGAIQYHFGTREELLLAVLERSFDRFVLSLAATELTGATVRDRLAALARVIWSHYGRPEYVAVMQIHLNLSRDPKRAQATEDAMLHLTDGIISGWRALIERGFGPELGRQGLDVFIFESLRGHALGDAIAREGPERVVSRLSDQVVRANQSRLIDALSEHIERALATTPAR